MDLRPIDKIIWDAWNTTDFYTKVKEYFSNKKIHVVLDLGAGVGVATQFFQKYLSPDLIICFEPDIDNFEMLSNNFNESNIFKYNYGIFYGATECTVNGVGDNSPLGYMLSVIDKEHYENWSVSSYPEKIFHLKELEEFCQIADVIKIDVEGSEYNIIENSSCVQNSKWLLLETHNHMQDYIHEYIKQRLPNHVLIFEEGGGIHQSYLLERNG